VTTRVATAAKDVDEETVTVTATENLINATSPTTDGAGAGVMGPTMMVAVGRKK